MFGLPASVKIFLAPDGTDMRKGHDGLAALVNKLGGDVFSGHLFVFLSKKRNRIKILWWERGGFVLWYKRLEKGRFKLPPIEEETQSITLDAAELAMLLDGIDFSRVKRSKVWMPPKKETKGIDIRPAL